MNTDVQAFFDEATNTVSYVVAEPGGGRCAIIDSVLDFDHAAGRTGTASADAIIAFVRARNLEPVWLLETHVHADHLSAAPYLKDQIGGEIGIGDQITTVQTTFGEVFGEDARFRRDGSQFDRLFADGDTFPIGALQARIMHTPGHTPACLTYVVGDAAFVGDTLFMPDFGTARADFPGGSAERLYASIQNILALHDATRIFVGHDYKAPGRDTFAWETTVAEQKARNVHVGRDATAEAFVAMREARDRTLGAPKLILPSIQVNMRGGRMPEPDANGRRFLKLPLNEL